MHKLPSFVGRVSAKARTFAVCVTAIAAGLLVTASAHATPPTYVTDIGVDATDVITGLTDVLVPFLVAAITIGFAFFAVKLGVKWIKGFARG